MRLFLKAKSLGKVRDAVLQLRIQPLLLDSVLFQCLYLVLQGGQFALLQVEFLLLRVPIIQILHALFAPQSARVEAQRVELLLHLVLLLVQIEHFGLEGLPQLVHGREALRMLLRLVNDGVYICKSGGFFNLLQYLPSRLHLVERKH